MEINITWNICRVCLREDNKDSGQQLKPIFGDGNKIAKSIFDFSDVMMKPNDGLPDKICLKCIKILKYALYFRKTCRQSDSNLKSVVQRTKLASNLLRQERGEEVVGEEDSEDDDEGLTSIANIIDTEDEEYPEKSALESHNRNFKRKGSHEQLPRQKRVKQLMGEQTSSQIVTGDSTPKYENAVSVPEAVITHNDEEVELEIEGITDNTAEDLKQIRKTEDGDNSNNSHVVSEETATQEDVEDHITPSTLDVYNAQSNVEPNTSEGLEEKILDVHDIDIDALSGNVDEDDIDQMTEEESENKTSLFYIINDIKVDNHNDSDEHEQSEEDAENVSDDNVDFIPLEEEEDDDMQQQELDESNNDIDDNQGDVTSTVKEEEIDMDGADSSISHQGVDDEYIVNEFVIDSYDNTRSPNNNPLIRVTPKSQRSSQKLCRNLAEEQLQEISSVCRKQGGNKPSATGTFPIVCELCGNNFTSRQLLNVHMKIHRQEKAHECELCFKRFITACNLQAHIRIHTGEKPYECRYCSRRFADRSTHIRHERIHTNEKPFACDSCGKSFALATTLQAHLKVHTGERPYRCEPCAKSFKLAHQLKAHKSTGLHKTVEQLGFRLENGK